MGSDRRLPIALIVDDGVPCINPLYYFAKQVDRVKTSLADRIPLLSLKEFVDRIVSKGVRGDFSVIPYPAGLGPITDKLSGYDEVELRCWLDTVREHVMPQFDIHPEMLTHTLALDLETHKLLDVSEHDWMVDQTEETLMAYFARAMEILKEADLPNNGITQPCHFNGDEELYARAILSAEKKVNGRMVTHYFLHIDSESPVVVPKVTCMNSDAKETVISIISGTRDAFWSTNREKCVAEELAGKLIREDGRSGRIVELIHNQSTVVFHTHWQSLFSNGYFTGLLGLEIVVRRIEQYFSDQVRWTKLSEITDEIAEKSLH